MPKSIDNAKKSRGRPRIDATPVTVRIPPNELAALDAWIAQRPDRPKPTRPEAIRRLMELGLRTSSSPALASSVENGKLNEDLDDEGYPLAKNANARRFLLRVDQVFLEIIDTWRRQQPDLPSRSEAIRRLVENKTTPASPARTAKTRPTPTKPAPAKARAGARKGSAKA